MTRKTFYKKLRECAGTFEWRITRDGKIRGSLNHKYYCPITAIARHMGKGYWNPCDADYCGFLNSIDSSDIIKAADFSEEKIDMHFNTALKQTRRALIKAVGL